MGTEIERKFLTKDGWREEVESSRRLLQGYLAIGEVTVRVREDGKSGWITVKGPTSGISRDEFEYEVPVADARAMLAMCGASVVEKTRHQIPKRDGVWEVDEFAGRNAGLVVAEIELDETDADFDRPAWLGREVTFEPRYTNASLAIRPFELWKQAQE